MSAHDSSGGNRPPRRPPTGAGHTGGPGPGGASGGLPDLPRRPVADPEAKPRGMERLGDLLPETVRQFGLEEQLELARASTAWLRLIEERVPAAAGSCRLTGLSQGIATIETDEPIVAQELRLRSMELLAGLRGAIRGPVRQLRITTRHV